MPVTLAQAQVNSMPDVDFNVVENLRRTSWLLDQIAFDDVATPGGGGAMTYSYNRLVTPASAAPRAINTEYTPGKATRDQVTVNLKPFGGSFELDRVLRNLGPAATSEQEFQLLQLQRASVVRVQQEIVLGDTAVDARGFDGLSKVLTGTVTESLGATLDLTPATLNTQVLALQALDRFDLWLNSILPSTTGSGTSFGQPGVPPGTRAILGNTASIGRIRALARWAAMFNSSTDNLDRFIESYRGWTLVDIGDRMDGLGPIIPTGASVAGETDVYAVSFGMDSLHGASLAGIPLLSVFLPNWQDPAAVKLTELEMGPLAIVLKNTKAAGVFRKVKVI